MCLPAVARESNADDNMMLQFDSIQVVASVLVPLIMQSHAMRAGKYHHGDINAFSILIDTIFLFFVSTGVDSQPVWYDTVIDT